MGPDAPRPGAGRRARIGAGLALLSLAAFAAACHPSRVFDNPLEPGNLAPVKTVYISAQAQVAEAIQTAPSTNNVISSGPFSVSYLGGNLILPYVEIQPTFLAGTGIAASQVEEVAVLSTAQSRTPTAGGWLYIYGLTGAWPGLGAITYSNQPATVSSSQGQPNFNPGVQDVLYFAYTKGNRRAGDNANPTDVIRFTLQPLTAGTLDISIDSAVSIRVKYR